MDFSEDSRALPVLYRISALASRGDEPRGAIAEILHLLIETFSASSGSVALLNPDSGRLEIEVQQGLPEDSDEVSLRLGQGITGWVAFHAQPQLVRDVTVDARYIRLRPAVQSEMAAPMLGADGQVFGVINVDSDQRDAFDEPGFACFVRLVNEAAAVMSRLWQRRQLEEKARQLEVLIGVGQGLVTQLEARELYESVTVNTRQLMRVHACALYLHDPDQANVQLVAQSGGSNFPPQDREWPLDTCLMAASIRTRKQVEFGNLQSPEFLDLEDIPRDPALRSMLTTPLFEEDRVIGVLAVFTERLHRFNNDEKRLAAALAGLGAVAVQNARLYTRVFQSEESLRKHEQLTTLGLLASEIAHEIRNPLTVIKLLFWHLHLDFPEGDQRRNDVRLIGEKLDQLAAIVTRVLSFAKAPSSLHSRWNVTEVIEETILLIRLKLVQSKIQLNFEPPSQVLVIDVHKGQIQQVLLNLLINATQAMPEGGEIAIRVSTEDRHDAPHVAIDVVDSGSGIPSSIHEKIFDSFLSGRPDGTGLGLAIAKRILVSHHGDIQLVASSPTGTTLRILLPLART